MDNNKITIINIIKASIIALCLSASAFTMTGCGQANTSSVSTDMIDTTDMFTSRDLDSSYNNVNDTITLSNSSITSEKNTVDIVGSTVTINKEGTYVLSGESSNANIIINASDKEKVQLVLNNANISSNSNAPLQVVNADKVFITTAENTKNNISSSTESYSENDSNIDGAIFSKTDLTINGTGILNITSDKNNGIVCKDDLKITDGTINITASNHGIDSNNSFRSCKCNLNISSENDGIHTEHENSEKGYVYIASGTYTISAKDDGVHASKQVLIEDGNVTVTNSYEGLEGQQVYITGGDINITSSDDGINSAGGNDQSGFKSQDQNTPMKQDDPMASEENAVLEISGGTLRVNASGDGLDSNGTILISGGTTYVSGPTNDGNTAIDYGTSATITGGTLVAAGSSGMVEGFSTDSTQNIMTLTTTDSGQIKLTDSDGNTLVDYTPEKIYSCVTISTPELKLNTAYKLQTGNASQDITLTEQLTNNVQSNMGRGGMRGNMPDNKNGEAQSNMPKDMRGKMNMQENGTPPTPPDNNIPENKNRTNITQK